MHNFRRLVVLGVIVVLIGAVSTTTAHEERTVEGYDLTFGGADEPVITGERTWLEVEIVDNETGDPVDGQAETLQVSVQGAGHEKVPLDVSERHDAPGVYRAAVVFTTPGEYAIHVEGSLNGAEIHAHFGTTVHDRAELEYPGDAAGSDVGDASVHDDHNGSGTDGSEAEDQPGDDGDRVDHAGPGFDLSPRDAISVVGLMAVIGVLLFRRRR